MHVIERAKDILLKPKETWAAIDEEPATLAGLYTGYLMMLAAIPAICGFVGMSLIGVSGFGVTVRIPLVAGLANMVVSYVLSLVGVYVLALVINALAKTFGGTSDSIQALKVAVYASTAALLGGIFSLLPAMAVLGLVAALYSLYLLYVGLPVLMRNPPERSLAYTVVVVVAAIVLSIVIGAVGSIFTPSSRGMWGGAESATAVAVDTPKGRVTLDTVGLEAAGKKMEEAARRMEEAQKSGDANQVAAAAAQAVAAAMGAAGGGQAVDVQSLKAALPASLGGLPRTALEAQDTAAMGLPTSQASAEYGRGDALVRVSIVDAGGLGQLAQLAGKMQSEHETETSVEKIWQEGGRTLQQNYEKDGSQSEFKVVLKNGVIVTVEAQNMAIKEAQALMGQINLPALESLQRKSAS